VPAVRFSKWHCLGNSYILVEREDVGAALSAALARRLCDPGVGIGADGVLEIVAVDGGRVELLVWNPDGSTAELSGNGTRIAARWLADRDGFEEVRVAVGGREIPARMRGGTLVEQDMGRVEVGKPEELLVNGERLIFTPVSIGNPHAVVDREPLRDALLRLGPLVERHPRFPGRTNVQLVRRDGPHDVTALVWERGAGETSASGTSACAVASAAVANGWTESPVTVHMPGGALRVDVDGDFSVHLLGPAAEICRGEAFLG
jgi:diaminopimelate epimerase